MIIRKMVPEDWNSVFEIYRQGIDSGKATFSTQYPVWTEWNEGHHPACRYVAVKAGDIAGFAAVSPASAKAHYSGVAEVSVYVDEKYWHEGIGTGLLETLIHEAPGHGIWCLYSSIFSSNEKSIRLHQKCGFRTIGYRERIAKDRYGVWTDTLLMEYRFPDELVKE